MPMPDASGRRRAERRGHLSETIAATMLQAKLFKILDRRVRTPKGELDIIARRGSLIVFAEVKARASHDAALLSVTPHQARRIADAARYWLTANDPGPTCDYRFDIVTVSSYLWPRHIPNAFTPEAW